MPVSDERQQPGAGAPAGRPGDVPLTAVPGFAIGRLPRITFGSGSFGGVAAIVAGHGQRLLLVTGGTWFDTSGGRAQLDAGLAGVGVRLVGSTTVSGEPGLADVEGPLERYRDAGVDVVLGVGGGAAIDTAKAIAGLLRSGTSLMDHLEGVGRGLPYPGPAVPVVAAPTTAGTGAEATRNAVITERGPQGYKRSFRDERLVPADAVVDPDLLATAPRPLIAANGLDALTQLLEAYDVAACDALHRCPGARRAGRRCGRACSPGTPTRRDRLLRRRAARWPMRRCSPASASPTPGWERSMAWPARSAGSCPSRTGWPAGPSCGRPSRRTCAPWRIGPRMGRRSAGTRMPVASWPTSGQPSRTRRHGRRWWTPCVAGWHAWRFPGLPPSAWGRSTSPPIVADSPGSSMRTNPVALTDAELTDILERAL